MHRLIPHCAFLAVCGWATVVPLIDHAPATTSAARFPGFPQEFENRPLTPLPISAMEERFNAGFPGKVGRFTDGRRELILRWITAPTRKLHPSSDCFRGLGYRVEPGPA